MKSAFTHPVLFFLINQAVLIGNPKTSKKVRDAQGKWIPFGMKLKDVMSLVARRVKGIVDAEK